MKTASLRDLRNRFPDVERALAKGHTITLTKRGRVVGELSPPKSNHKPEPKPMPMPKRKVVVPDFMARLRRIYGNKMLKTSGTELLAMDRDRY